MDPQTRIADLTVEQLQAIIRQTVQESVAEVMIDILLTAQYEADIDHDPIRSHTTLTDSLKLDD